MKVNMSGVLDNIIQELITSTLPFHVGNLPFRYRTRKRNKIPTPLGWKALHLTHIISSGQSTFLPALYDPISFAIFSLLACRLTHSKTKRKK